MKTKTYKTKHNGDVIIEDHGTHVFLLIPKRKQPYAALLSLTNAGATLRILDSQFNITRLELPPPASEEDAHDLLLRECNVLS